MKTSHGYKNYGSTVLPVFGIPGVIPSKTQGLLKNIRHFFLKNEIEISGMPNSREKMGKIYPARIHRGGIYLFTGIR